MIVVISFDRVMVSFDTEKAPPIQVTERYQLLSPLYQNFFALVELIGGKEAWRNLFIKIINSGHILSFVSFHKDAGYISYFLRSVLELPEEICDKILIQSWQPSSPNTADKNMHIRCLLVQMGSSAANQSILFVDPDRGNLEMAKDMCHFRLLADSSGGHIGVINQYIDRCPVNSSKRLVANTPTSKQESVNTVRNPQKTPLPEQKNTFNRSVEVPTYTSTNHNTGTQQLNNSIGAEVLPSFRTYNYQGPAYHLPPPRQTFNPYQSVLSQNHSSSSLSISRRDYYRQGQDESLVGEKSVNPRR